VLSSKRAFLCVVESNDNVGVCMCAPRVQKGHIWDIPRVDISRVGTKAKQYLKVVLDLRVCVFVCVRVSQFAFLDLSSVLVKIRVPILRYDTE
jgi:hypothetical protein